MSDPYDFEAPYLNPPAVCSRCGASVQKTDVHDKWHDSIPTLARAAVADAVTAVRSKLNYESEKPA